MVVRASQSRASTQSPHVAFMLEQVTLEVLRFIFSFPSLSVQLDLSQALHTGDSLQEAGWQECAGRGLCHEKLKCIGIVSAFHEVKRKRNRRAHGDPAAQHVRVPQKLRRFVRDPTLPRELPINGLDDYVEETTSEHGEEAVRGRPL